MLNYTIINPIIYTIEDITDLFEQDDTYRVNRVDNIVIQFGSSFHHLGRICYKSIQVANKNNRKLSVDSNSIDLAAMQFAKKLI